MKKIILLSAVCLLLVSSCQIGKLTVENSKNPRVKALNEAEIQMRKIDFNHPMYSNPFWVLNFNKRDFNLSDFNYINY